MYDIHYVMYNTSLYNFILIIILRCTYSCIICTLFFTFATNAHAMFLVYASILLAHGLQNRSVSALERFRFMEDQRAYKTIR